MDLLKSKCKPCEGGESPLGNKDVKELLNQISGWKLEKGHLVKQYKFKDFIDAINFVNKMAKLAEQEGHHPNIYINYNKINIELWTHAINGLSMNDFIMAAKIDRL